MVSPYSPDIPLVPDTVPSPPSRGQGRKMSRDNGQLLARDDGTAKRPQVTEGHLPREAELARNQIASSNVANGIVGILEWYTKDKNARCRSQGPRSECPCLSTWPPSRSRIFSQIPLIFATRPWAKVSENYAINATHRFKIKSSLMRSRD
jgi:hypothetical protein